MIPFLALVRKDLRLFFNDRRAVIVGLLVPIVCGSFFGYLFGGQGGKTETSRMQVLAIDQDGSAISRAIIEQLSNDKNLDVKPSTVDEAREQVRKGKVTAAIVIPKDFGTDAGHAFFGGGKKPEISLLYDPSRGMELGMVQGILSGAVMQAVSKEMFSGPTGRLTTSLANGAMSRGSFGCRRMWQSTRVGSFTCRNTATMTASPSSQWTGNLC